MKIIFFYKKMRKNKYIARIVFLILICAYSLTSFSCTEGTDWEYEYHYYTEIRSTSHDTYIVRIPLPLSEDMQLDSKKYIHLDNYLSNIKIEKGECIYNVFQYDSLKYLEIKSKDTLILSTTFALWDEFINFTLSPSQDPVSIFSNRAGLSIIIASRVVKKLEKKKWGFFYSAVISKPIDVSKVSISTWKARLDPSYSIEIKKGLYQYPIAESIKVWGGVEIR